MAITPSATGRPRARYRGHTSAAIHASKVRPTTEKQAICTACCAAEWGGLIRARMPITANPVSRISQKTLTIMGSVSPRRVTVVSAERVAEERAAVLFRGERDASPHGAGHDDSSLAQPVQPESEQQRSSRRGDVRARPGGKH